jgi:hypothetical protein
MKLKKIIKTFTVHNQHQDNSNFILFLSLVLIENNDMFMTNTKLLFLCN